MENNIPIKSNRQLCQRKEKKKGLNLKLGKGHPLKGFRRKCFTKRRDVTENKQPQAASLPTDINFKKETRT